MTDAAPLAGGFLRTVSLHVRDVAAHGDLLSRSHTGDIDLIQVREVYPADHLASLVARIARKEVDFPALPIPGSARAHCLGHSLDLTQVPLDEYFEDALQTRECLRDLFSGADFEERVTAILSGLSGGRPARLMEHGDGRIYSPSTVRYLGPGGYIRMHCEDQKLGEPAKQRIWEVAHPHVSSFYLMMLPPRSGGELMLYDLTWSQVEDHLFDQNGQLSSARVLGRYRAEGYPLAAGDMVFFGNGRIHEVRPVGPDTSRWSVGGFYTISQDDRTVYYFS